MDLETWIEDTCNSMRVESTHELRMVDGRWLQASVRPSKDGSLTLISDITLAKKAAEEMAALNSKLDELASTDGLTGLLNRRGFDGRSASEFARSARSGEPISVLIADVDRFKAYNDTYGHPQGDECLKDVGQCLKDSLRRPADIAARYGGEEFVALLPGTTPEGALSVAETFRNAVRKLHIPHSGSELRRVTVTVGIATHIAGDDELPGDVVRRADRALYTGKANGRDQCIQIRPPRNDRLAARGLIRKGPGLARALNNWKARLTKPPARLPQRRAPRA